MEPSRGGDGQVGQEGQTLGLPKYRLQLPTVGSAQVHDAKGVKLDHEFRGKRGNVEAPVDRGKASEGL